MSRNVRRLRGFWTGVVGTAAALVVVTATAATPELNEDAKLSPSDGEPGDLFGGAEDEGVAISGDTIVVGAYKDDDGGLDAGSAYVFGADGSGGWTEDAKFTASDAAAGDNYGWSVAVSGDTVVVGSVLDDLGTLNDAGSAYVYTPDGAGGWSETKLTASDAASSNWFGYSVAISGDTIVVGAPVRGVAIGAAYVFVSDGSGGWTESAILTASDGSLNDWLGWSVGISGDTIVASAFREDPGGVSDAGSAYVFEADGSGGWNETAKLSASDAAALDNFGWTIDVSGDVVVVGALHHDGVGANSGAAYVYGPDGSGSWTQAAKLTASDAAAGDRLGYSVGVSGDTIVVGATNDDHGGFVDAGAAYVFAPDGAGGWMETTRLIASDATSGRVLSRSLAISDGTVVAISAGGAGDGTGYVFGLTPPNAPPTSDAGPDQSISHNNTVNLSGANSMDDQTATGDLIYAWTLTVLPAGSTAVLVDDGTQTPSFFADKPGTYEAELVVTDEGGLSSVADEVIISSLNVAPTADAGNDQVVPTGSTTVLAGSGTDPDMDPLTYAWAIYSAPAGSTATLVDAATATPTITPDLEGSYVIRLIVNDGFEDSDPSDVTLMAVSPGAFAELQLAAACDYVAALPDSSFDAKGHRKSMCNDYAQIAKFIQKGQVGQAISHLSAAIERVDGCALRGSPDPKGAGQLHAADYLVDGCTDQVAVYPLLTSALAAIQ